FKKTAAANSPIAKLDVLGAVADFVLWYAKAVEHVKYRPLYEDKTPGGEGASAYQSIELADGTRRRLTSEEKQNPSRATSGRLFRVDNLTSAGWSETLSKPYTLNGKQYVLPSNLHWKTTPEGINRLAAAHRVAPVGNSLAYVRFIDDFRLIPRQNIWTDTATG